MDKAKLTASAPILLVSDVTVSANWYREKLGFKIVDFYGDGPDFVILQRDGQYIMFSRADKKDIVPNWKIVEKTSNVYFWVDDVEKLYFEYLENKATIDWDLCTQPYGVKEFGINDPDGYDVAFGEVIK